MKIEDAAWQGQRLGFLKFSSVLGPFKGPDFLPKLSAWLPLAAAMSALTFFRSEIGPEAIRVLGFLISGGMLGTVVHTNGNNKKPHPVPSLGLGEEFQALREALRQDPADLATREALGRFLKKHSIAQGETIELAAKLSALKVQKQKERGGEQRVELTGEIGKIERDLLALQEGVERKLRDQHRIGPEVKLRWQDGHLFAAEVRDVRAFNRLFESELGLFLCHLSIAPVDDGGSIQGLFRSPHLLHLTGLDLPGCLLKGRARSHQDKRNSILANKEIRALAYCSFLRHLTSLTLSGEDIGVEGAALLAASPHLRNLRTLNIIGNFEAEAVRILGGSPYLRGLKNLKMLHNHKLGVQGIRALAESPAFQGLISLDLSDSRLGIQEMAALVDASSLGKLKKLNISRNPLGTVIVFLVNSSSWELRELDVSYAQLRPQDVQALALAKSLENLESLNLSGNNFETNPWLLSCLTQLAKLSVLGLWNTGLGYREVRNLLNIQPAWKNLQKLGLSWNGNATELAEAIQKKQPGLDVITEEPRLWQDSTLEF